MGDGAPASTASSSAPRGADASTQVDGRNRRLPAFLGVPSEVYWAAPNDARLVFHTQRECPGLRSAR
eukprot:3140408-Lingulodinium_polyedra.AAC.1